MASISPELLERALADNAEAGRALFRDVIEPLADGFDAELVDEYVRLFAPVIERVYPELRAGGIIARYERVRKVRRAEVEPARVFVLSRVTIGADVAVTSIILDAAKKRWPRAEIVFVGPAKNYALVAGDSRISHKVISYPRLGTLRQRLAVHDALTLAEPDSIVIDPDSRLTQLGLLPVCTEERYFFFESRAYGGDGEDSLVALTKRWAGEVMGVEDARAYIAVPEAGRAVDVTVSLGVGENPAKRVADPFESELLRMLTARFDSVVVDSGGGGEEAERVRAAVGASGDRAEIFTGSFAEFARLIARSRLYVGYDSAGGHVAAACGVPMISVFGGAASERMMQRWQPDGPGPIQVVRADGRGADDLLEDVALVASRY